ncbi:MAG: VWA domain-containing protein [Rikenellaceae bacterium]
MFRFANPEYLYILIGIPVLIFLFWLSLRQRRSRLERFGYLDMVKSLMPSFSIGSVKLKFTLFVVAIALLILAAARPQVGSKLREEKSRGVEMMLVVDVSNSMLAEDFAPNRLSKTQYAIERLFEGLKSQERVGLIAFAGEAKVELPITSDYRMASSFARRLSPSMVGVQGTDVGKALDLAILSFSSSSESSKVVVLITDGEAHDSGAISAAERAAAMGIKIFTVGIGTPEGAPITLNGEFIKDENGDMVVTKLNEAMLQQIASITEAGYVKATNQSLGLGEITKTISEMEQGELATVKFEEYGEQYQYLVALALLLILLELFILDKKNRYLRRFNIFAESESEISKK